TSLPATSTGPHAAPPCALPQEAATSTAPAGTGSWNCAPSADPGPLLDTTTVQVSARPGRIVAGPGFTPTRSASGFSGVLVLSSSSTGGPDGGVPEAVAVFTSGASAARSDCCTV